MVKKLTRLFGKKKNFTNINMLNLPKSKINSSDLNIRNSVNVKPVNVAINVDIPFSNKLQNQIKIREVNNKNSNLEKSEIKSNIKFNENIKISENLDDVPKNVEKLNEQINEISSWKSFWNWWDGLNSSDQEAIFFSPITAGIAVGLTYRLLMIGRWGHAFEKGEDNFEGCMSNPFNSEEKCLKVCKENRGYKTAEIENDLTDESKCVGLYKNGKECTSNKSCHSNYCKKNSGSYIGKCADKEEFSNTNISEKGKFIEILKKTSKKLLNDLVQLINKKGSDKINDNDIEELMKKNVAEYENKIKNRDDVKEIFGFYPDIFSSPLSLIKQLNFTEDEFTRISELRKLYVKLSPNDKLEFDKLSERKKIQYLTNLNNKSKSKLNENANKGLNIFFIIGMILLIIFQIIMIILFKR